MIAIKSPLETGTLVCRGCFKRRELSAFEPVSDGKWGVRRRCRDCRQPIYDRYKRKRLERRARQLEAQIATVPEGPELAALAEKVLAQYQQVRFVRMLACRLKAGPLELDAEGRPIVPPTVKLWANPLDCRQAEFFCRRKLRFPPLPAEKRAFGKSAGAREFIALLKLATQFYKAQRRAKQQAERLEMQHLLRGEGRDLSRRAKLWVPDYHHAPNRTIEELYIERLMSIPPPPYTNTTAAEVDSPRCKPLENTQAFPNARQDDSPPAEAIEPQRPPLRTAAEIISAVAQSRISQGDGAALLQGILDPSDVEVRPARRVADQSAVWAAMAMARARGIPCRMIPGLP